MEMSHNHRNRGASFGHKDKRRARSRKNHRFAGPYDGHDRYLSQPQDGIYDDRYNDRPNGKHNGTHDPRYDAKHEPKQKDRYVDRYVDRYIDKSQDSNGNSNGSQGTSPRTPSTASSQLPSGPRALDSKEKKPKISGTNPITGVNDHDANFAKLQHHSDFEANLAFPHNVDHRKNYKVVDPFSKTKNIRFNGGDILQVSDPRLNNVLHYFQKPNKTSKKFPFKQLPQTRFQYDKDSLGPPPQTDLVVWDLPATTQEIYLCNYFKSFEGNDIKDIKFVNDPNYAVPLGIVSFRFHGNVEKAAKLAKKLVNTIRAERPKIDGVPLKIDLNDEHNMFLNSKIEIAREKLRISRKIREEEEKKLRREMEEKRKLEEKKKQQEKKRLVEKDQESSKDLYKFKPNTTLLSRRHNNKIVPGVLLPDDLKKYVKDRPYILIQDKYVPTKKITSLDIKRTLNKYDWTRVISDKVGFFVVFNSLKEAERCFINEDGRKFYEYRLFMELATPKGFEKEGNEEQDLFTSKSTKHDIIDEAANMLIKEFQSFLSKDIRERIIAPAVLDLLSHERYPQLVAELKAKEAAEKAAQASVKDSAQIKQEALSKLSKNKLNSLQQSLPSFKKKNDSTKKSKKSLVPMQHALNYDHDSEEEDEDESTSRSLTPVASSLKRGRASTVTSVEPEDEHEDKKQKTGLRKTFLYESSSDEEMEEEVEEEKVELKDENEEDSIEIDKEIPAEAEEIDYSKSDEKYQPTEIKPRPVYREPRLLPSDAFDLDVLQSVIKDNEDLEMARLVLSEMELEPSKFKKNIDYWAWKQKDLNSVSQEIVEDVELIGTLNEKLQNPTGSFRSEGYKKILEKDKIDYLPHRRKIHKPLKTVQHEDDEDDTDGKLNGSGNVTTNNTNSVPSSRVNRANNRRFAADITAQIGTETEVLSLNALTKRKKPVSFARSAIHNWGLYALEPIGAKEMIIEYVGEQIRQQVAEHREKSYLKTGIGSSYLFRIDENTVIDATKKGGIARFINHCCNPSCTAKIIKVEGTKRIVIYALRDIEANEELTYDYKFERETNDEERIPCLCGAPGCKGYLN